MRIWIKILLLAQIFLAFDASSLIVKNVDFSGLHRIEKGTARVYLDINAGDDVSDATIAGAIKRMYRTGYFADVSIDMNESTGKMTVNVVENPIINDIKLSGIKSSAAKTILESISSKNRGIYNKDKIRFDTEFIRASFIKSGNINTTVVPRISYLDKNRVNLFFDIDTGGTITVDRVNFIGNKFYSDYDLHGHMTMSGGNSLRNTVFTSTFAEEKVDMDKDIISYLYMNNGFADFEIKSVSEYSPEVARFAISYLIEEGERYKFADISVGYESDEVKYKIPNKLIKTKSGKIFNKSKIEQTIYKISLYLTSTGLANVVVVPEINKDKENRLVSVKYVIKKSDVFYINRINVSGNDKTHDYVIRRELLIKEGDYYNSSLIRKSKERLIILDFFENVEIKEKHVGKDLIDLDISIKERTRADGINLNAGYTTFGGLIYGADLTVRNIFGRGYSGTVGVTKSIWMSNYGFSITNPKFLNRDLSLSFNINRSEFGSAKAFMPFKSITNSVGVTIGYPILDKLYQYWGFTLQESNFRIKSSLNAPDMYKDMGNYATYGLISHTLAYDGRDHPLLPRSGVMAKLTTSFTGFGIGNQRFIQNDFGIAAYIPLSKTSDWILSFMFYGGHIQGLGKDVMFQNRYAVGYMNMRGFYFMGLGPHIGTVGADGSTSYFFTGIRGNTYAVLSTDLAIPLPIPREYNIRFTIFSDVGTSFGVDGPNSIINSKGLREFVADSISPRVSVGAGITWISPIGPIRVDYAQPIVYERYDNLQTFRITFTILPF